MRKWLAIICLVGVAAVAAAFLGARWATRGTVEVPDHDASAERGAYLFAAAGCETCHTAEADDAVPLAGGRALDTPFGVFYTPNITPDADHGIGGWSDADFLRAMRQGVSPDGDDYYPAFPYPSFTRMTDADILDLKAYLFTLPAAATPNRAHEVAFPFNMRPLLTFWKLLFLNQGPEPSDPSLDEPQARGAYLVRALGHCGECHTPRNAMGAPVADMQLAGTVDGPDGRPVPNITPDEATGIGRWSAEDIVFLLRSGMMPDGDFVGSGMGDVVANGTSHLTGDDLQAIAAYLRAVPAVANQVGPAESARSRETEDW